MALMREYHTWGFLLCQGKTVGKIVGLIFFKQLDPAGPAPYPAFFSTLQFYPSYDIFL